MENFFKDYDLTTPAGQYEAARAIMKLSVKDQGAADLLRPLLSEALNVFSPPMYTVFATSPRSFNVIHHNFDWMSDANDEYRDFCRNNISNYCCSAHAGYTDIRGLTMKGELEQIHTSWCEHWWVFADANNKLWFMQI